VVYLVLQTYEIKERIMFRSVSSIASQAGRLPSEKINIIIHNSELNKLPSILHSNG